MTRKSRKKRKKSGKPKVWSGRNCPSCGDKRTVQLSEHLFRCNGCDGYFDDDPDEGCPEVYDDPVKSLEAKERREREALRLF